MLYLEKTYLVIELLLGLLYLYQVGYLVVGLWERFGKPRSTPRLLTRLGRYAVFISARNEEGVIGGLIESLREQDYPTELLDIYVVADNCTDRTAEAAYLAGATKVYVRCDHAHMGKGYALDYLWHKLVQDGIESRYEGYFIFDADNVVDSRFVMEMNLTFQKGNFAAVTGYRNAKNYGENWISAGYSVWFLREARFVNAARMALGLNCHVSGTGFLISAEMCREKRGWPWHLLTEDIQLSVEAATRGQKIGYCGSAIFYDEQPTSFRQSWRQRERWSKGMYQVSGRYTPALVKGIFRGGYHGFSCYDLLILVNAGVLMLVAGVVALTGTAAALIGAKTVALAQAVLALAGSTLWQNVIAFYRGMLLYGLVTVISEWKAIHATPLQKLGYLLTFPIFMMTYLPISVVAFFRKVEWKPITHKTTAAKMDSAA